MKKIISLILCALCAITGGLRAQSPLPSMPSPTASNLGLYGEVPVSEFTGTPNISIPLYELKTKSFTIPVALSYHASGIRPELHPGPTGLGWTLLTGGAITREVRRLPDENDCKGLMGTVGYGYLIKKDILAQADWKPSNNPVDEEKIDSYFSADNLNSDFEADQFSFNFFGISGKFYFDHTGNIRVQSDRLLTVSFNPNNYLEMSELDFADKGSIYRAIREFVITDERGNRYYFGGKDAVEISDPISYGLEGVPTKDKMRVTSWFITKAESADGQDVISFEYERGPFISQLYKSVNERVSEWVDKFQGIDLTASMWQSMSGYNQNGSFISPVYLRSITSSNGTVLSLFYSESRELKYPDEEYRLIFKQNGLHPEDPYPLLSRTSQIPRLNDNITSPPVGYSNPLDNIRWLKCDVIAIQQESASQIKTVEFHYNNNPSERLFLDSLTIKGETQGKDGPYGPPVPSCGYSFKYKNRHRLRPYLENITDHWGFDNGRGFGISFAPSLREPNVESAQNGILSSIHYPTGGITTFEYEGHDYAKVVDNKNRTLVLPSEGVAGGVRIRKITSDDGKGGGFSKEYFYRISPTATVSSGILNATPVYAYSIDVTLSSQSKIQHFYLQNTPVVPLTQWNAGIPIAYTDVCVRQSGEGVNNGYIHYTFTNHDNGHTDDLLAEGQYHRESFPQGPHNSRVFERGKLKKEVHYNAAGKPIYKKETTWERYGSQGEDNPRSLLFDAIPAPTTMNMSYKFLVCYLNYVYKFLPAKQVETVFDVNGTHPVTKTTTYTYNAQMLLSAEETTTSNGIRKTTYKYPFDFVTTEPYKTMVAKHIVSSVVEKSQYQDNVFLQKDLTRYKKWASTLFAPEFIQTQTNRQTVPDNHIQYLDYDKYGNPLAVLKNDGENIVYLWSYGGQYLVAEIRNATLREVDAVLNSTLGVSSADVLSVLVTPNETKLKNGSLQRALPKSQVTTYTHKPLMGMISSTDPAGLTTTYEYDTFGRLAKVKDPDGHAIESYKYNYAH